MVCRTTLTRRGARLALGAAVVGVVLAGAAAACSHDWMVPTAVSDDGGTGVDADADAARPGCNVTRTCVPELIVAEIADPRRFVVTDQAVIWTDAFNDYVGTRLLDGGARTTERIDAADGLATDGTIVFAGGEGTVRLPVAARIDIGYGCGVTAMAVQDSKVFWITTNGEGCQGLRSTLKTETRPERATNDVLYGDAGSPRELAVTPALLAIADDKNTLKLYSTQDPTAGPVRTFTNLNAPAGLVGTPAGFVGANRGRRVSGQIEARTGSLVEYRATGDPRVLVTGLAHPHDVALALDEDRIYFVSAGTPPGFLDGTVARIRIDGTGLETLVSGLWNPQQIRLHGPYVYWMNRASTGDDTTPTGSIARVLK